MPPNWRFLFFFFFWEEDNNSESKEGSKKEEESKIKKNEEEAFISVTHDPPPATPLFSVGDGFDVYIDAARFLPDNVTIPKVTARVFNHDFHHIEMSSSEKQETAVCELTDNVFCPEW